MPFFMDIIEGLPPAVEELKRQSEEQKPKGVFMIFLVLFSQIHNQ